MASLATGIQSKDPRGGRHVERLAAIAARHFLDALNRFYRRRETEIRYGLLRLVYDALLRAAVVYKVASD